MPNIAYGTGAYRRDTGGMPEVRLVNMFVETAPTSETGAVLLSREGLTVHSSPGAGPIAGLFQEAGVFNGDVFAVSGGILYRGTAAIGTIAGTGPVSFAASDTELAITAGSTLYRYDGATLAAVAFPDGAPVRAIRFHDGLFIAITGSKFYWSAVLDADTWAGLDFASAERRPDPLYDLEIINDTLFLIGASTIEPWANTGEANLPYQRIEQRLYDRGARATGCSREIDNSLMFVGDNGTVYRLADVPQRVSDHGIEERIQASATVSTFAYEYGGHSFFAVRLDGGTWQFDLATGQWSELASYGRPNFRARCAITILGEPLFGDDEAGRVWSLSGWDDDGEPLVREFTAYFPVAGGAVTVDNIGIEANVGRTVVLSGLGSEPLAEMRSSRDGGITWGAYRAAPMGSQGNYRTRTRWRRCGMFDPPGGMFGFQVSDPIPLRISSVRVNEPGGGRSR